MNILTVAKKSLLNRKLTTLLTIFSLALKRSPFTWDRKN